MQRILTLTFLVLLALGFASQVQAQVRVQCWRCSSFDTYGHYKCTNPDHHHPVEWDEAAWSDSSSCPPYKAQCPQCGWWVDAEYCWDPDCTKSNPFWPWP
jgi:hypothetical protein